MISGPTNYTTTTTGAHISVTSESLGQTIGSAQIRLLSGSSSGAVIDDPNYQHALSYASGSAPRLNAAFLPATGILRLSWAVQDGLNPILERCAVVDGTQRWTLVTTTQPGQFEASVSQAAKAFFRLRQP